MINGKGWFIWIIDDCFDGDIGAIVQECKAGDVRFVVIKIADGVKSSNPAKATELVRALCAAGVEAWGWQYTYGSNPSAEALFAADRVLQTGVVGFVVDAEAQYKTAGAAAAISYMESLLANIPLGMKVGLCSYRYPSLHQTFPWAAFLERVDFVLPQVYWEKAHNPAYQLSRSYGEYLAIAPKLLYIPTGAAYKRGDWQSTPSDVNSFMDQALELGLVGVNFWEWGRAGLYVPATFEAVQDYYWPVADKAPRMVRVVDPKNASILSTINGSIVAFARAGQLLGVSMRQSVEDDNGNERLWFEVGDGWIPALAVEVIQYYD